MRLVPHYRDVASLDPLPKCFHSIEALPVRHFGMRYASAQGLIRCGICQNVAGVGCASSVDAATKKWPRKPGPSLGGVQGQARAIPPQNQLKIRAYRPKRGISPLRTAMRALDISQPSTVAIRRPNRVLDGASSREAVLDMSIPFCGASKRANDLGTIYVYQMPGTIPLFAWQHKSFCNAKWIDLDFLLKKAADFSATFEFIREFRLAYSAATLRGGSSAPESWISAT